jgi:hypothetical protein
LLEIDNSLTHSYTLEDFNVEWIYNFVKFNFLVTVGGCQILPREERSKLCWCQSGPIGLRQFRSQPPLQVYHCHVFIYRM